VKDRATCSSYFAKGVTRNTAFWLMVTALSVFIQLAACSCGSSPKLPVYPGLDPVRWHMTPEQVAEALDCKLERAPSTPDLRYIVFQKKNHYHLHAAEVVRFYFDDQAGLQRIALVYRGLEKVQVKELEGALSERWGTPTMDKPGVIKQFGMVMTNWRWRRGDGQGTVHLRRPSGLMSLGDSVVLLEYCSRTYRSPQQTKAGA
jgi:hypothetical protein